MLRERVQQRWQEPDAIWTPSAKTLEETHLRVAKDVAAQRLSFPTTEFPSFRTYVNVPEPALVIRTAGGQELAPDIVVAEWPRNVPKILAEVETVEAVTEESAEGKWRPGSEVPGTTFYLYVPSGYGTRAKAILKKLKIKGVGLRTWRYVTGQETLDITEMDYGSLLTLLLPPFLLNRHRL